MGITGDPERPFPGLCVTDLAVVRLGNLFDQFCIDPVGVEFPRAQFYFFLAGNVNGQELTIIAAKEVYFEPIPDFNVEAS